ncbi:MAG: sugar phosphate nucleotidyltransferase [Rhodospirillales bacterium]|nr:sugar phosphate nucleotidyltransferase [Rhodospirillales bacterium]HJP55252.1 sugar phosphate nucleotidyltransferase [Rhodospirillales bacterium]
MNHFRGSRGCQEQVLKKTLALVLAGGRGSRLGRLTARQAKPAVPFSGEYKIIDFTLSNCINSGIRHVGVLTQYNAHTLIQHVQRGWGFLRSELGEFVEVWPAQQRNGEGSWYQGAADAVYQNIDIMGAHGAEYVIVLAGDHVYKMNYAMMLAHHIERGADVTVACVEVPLKTATAFGVVGVDDGDNIVNFMEKPETPPSIPGKPGRAFASMGIYVFTTPFLLEQLARDAETLNSSRDFGRDVIPYLMARCTVVAHRFRDSWRNLGTVYNFLYGKLYTVPKIPVLRMVANAISSAKKI